MSSPWVPPASVRDPEEWPLDEAMPSERRRKFKLQPWLIVSLVILAAMIAFAIGIAIADSAEVRGEHLGWWWIGGVALAAVGSQTLWGALVVASDEAAAATIITIAIDFGEVFLVGKLTGVPFGLFGF